MTAFRPFVAAFVLVALLAGCGQAGGPEEAAEAANAFLIALRAGRSDEAWSHLTPATQSVVYRDDEAAFAQDVNQADWTQLTWQVGPITDLDISWGVHVEADKQAISRFLTQMGIAAGWEGHGIVILVQTPSGRPYLIAAQGLDYDLE